MAVRGQSAGEFLFFCRTTISTRLPQLASLETDTGGDPADGSVWPLELSLQLRWGNPPNSTSNRYDSRLVAALRPAGT